MSALLQTAIVSNNSNKSVIVKRYVQKLRRTLHLPGEPNLFNEVIKLLNDGRLDQLTTGDISNLGQSMNFLEAGWLKALFFVYFHSFSQIYNVAKISYNQKLTRLSYSS